MKDLVFRGDNNEALTSSLLVAEKFGKEHRNVLRNIRKIISGMLNFENTSMFVESNYINEQNKEKYPLFIMNRDGFTLLAMSFTGEKALRFKMDYIAAFNKMESIISNSIYNVPKSFREALLLAASQQEQIEEQQKQINEQQKQIDCMSSTIIELKQKTDYMDIILSTKGCVTITQIAQDYGMSAVKFNKILEDMRIQRKVNGQWILYAPYMTQGYVHSKTVNITRYGGISDTKMHTEWTQKGRLFLYQKLKTKGIIPLIEN